ncbi:DEKNAAC101079 [Brettanomyces naardenensis]|uniref:DEKNAAC101079 n=1 Tax=Brettanomyces naardenensis TaxID=13370 RepID=A0A448YH65_BRENA|nr:DEKNAAC101079 [Brettanomyces naardenensis]
MALKSEAQLEKLSAELKKNKSLRDDAAKHLDSKVTFQVHDKKGETVLWCLNAKKGEEVTLEKLKDTDDPEADIKVRIDDINLRKLIRGKQSAQRLFMTGKLKIKGNVMKAAYIEKLLKFAAPESSKL